jgi:hypothetical protein
MLVFKSVKEISIELDSSVSASLKNPIAQNYVEFNVILSAAMISVVKYGLR